MAFLLLRQQAALLRSKIHNTLWRNGLLKHSTAAEPLATTSALQVGDRVNNFVVEQVESIPEFRLTAVKLRHAKTGGEYLHIDRNDSNNVFSVGFRTTPLDSSGLPHILEHTTLTGSTKFPCRDPFFKMLNRSLATFMNAMTGPDFTVYPFSTQNPKDYRNLMSVYLDAVFRPRLRRVDFQQEGWRLEHENPSDPNSPIIFKGVVFNEMKGVFSDNQNIFGEALLNQMLPSHTYGVCSGGDPLIIPSLTHENLKKFHRQYYSPSNTKYYSYGNLSFSDHIAYIEKEYLAAAEPERADTSVPSEPRWSAPVRRHIACRVDPLAADPAKQSSIVISHLCCDITDIDENFTMEIISELLVKGPNAAFYKTLIEPNIGAGFSPVTGYESHTRDTYFTVGLQGVSENDFERIIELFDKTVRDVIEKGFEANHVEGILHGIELNTKHQSANFGLGLLFGITPLWNHGGDVIELLKIDSRVQRIRQNMAKDPKYLQKKVKKYLQGNPHRLVLTMSPDLDYDTKQQQEENRILTEKLESLDEKSRKEIYEEGLKLLDNAKEDNKECLPTLRVADLSRSVEKEDPEDSSLEGVPLQISSQPTNGIMYFRGLLPTATLSPELRPYLPLFARVAGKMGTRKRDYRAWDELVALKTGGISIGAHLTDSPATLASFEESIALSSYCLNPNISDMFDLVAELFRESAFEDVNRFESLSRSHAAELVNSVADMGHHYAMLSAAGLVSPACGVKERNGGLTYVNVMKEVAQDDAAKTLSKLKDIYMSVMDRSRLRCALNVLEGTKEDVSKEVRRFLQGLPARPANAAASQAQAESITPSIRGTFFILPFAVSYTSKALIAVPYQHEDFAPLRVLTRLATMNFLHPEVREKGGAYGSGMSLSMSGVLSFYSYRDPNPLNTLQTFDSTGDWVGKGVFTEQDVEEAKLGIFQGVDAPVPPGNKGMNKFLHGVTDAMLERHRLELMAVTKEQLIEVARKYINRDVPLVGRTVIGPENSAILDNSSQKWQAVVQN